MKILIVIVLFSTLACSVYCQFAEMMNNPAIMMSMMKGGMMGGGMGGMGMMPGMMPGMMDPSAAPVMDPKMFAKLAKMATLLGPSAQTGKATTKTVTTTMKGNNAKVVKKQTKPAPTQSGIDPFLMYTMMQSGQMDPMALMLMSQASSKPAATSGSSGSSGGLDPFTMMYLMQQGGGGGLFG